MEELNAIFYYYFFFKQAFNIFFLVICVGCCAAWAGMKPWRRSGQKYTSEKGARTRERPPPLCSTPLHSAPWQPGHLSSAVPPLSSPPPPLQPPFRACGVTPAPKTRARTHAATHARSRPPPGPLFGRAGPKGEVSMMDVWLVALP